MPRLNNPITIEIKRDNGRLMMLDIFPIYVERENDFVTTDNLRLYEGYPPDERKTPEDILQRERYLSHLEARGADNPNYLGMLLYRPCPSTTWFYNGDRLTAFEMQQILAILETYAPDTAMEEAAIQSILGEKESDNICSFVYNNSFCTDLIRVEATDGPYLIFVNEELSAEIEQKSGQWVLVAGQIEDPELLMEITRKIGESKN